MSKDEGLESNAIELADLFCRQRKSLILNIFRKVKTNNDKLAMKVSKKLLAEKYSWLESDIIND